VPAASISLETWVIWPNKKVQQHVEERTYLQRLVYKKITNFLSDYLF